MYNFACDWKSGFLMDPIKKARTGYLVTLDGFGLALARDVTVYTPFRGEPEYSLVKGEGEASADESNGIRKVNAVGVIDHFSWGGGVGDPICISVYVSAENANQIKMMQKTLKTTAIKECAWWIVNFDEEEKVWFEEAYPASGNAKVSGQLNAPGKTDIRLAAAMEPEKFAPHIDVNVYNVYFEVVPAANQTYNLRFATSASKKFVKGWGLQIGGKRPA